MKASFARRLPVLLSLVVLGSASLLLSACSATQLLTEVQTRVAAANAKVYAVGDTGPAGGIVFYDKGAYSNGWRYLEVAPVSGGVTIPWDTYGTPALIGVTATGIGSGKSNTDLIVATLGPSSGYAEPLSSFAAGICASYTLNGFSDWFLPSRDELDKIYVHRDLIGYPGTSYWSSTEVDAANADYENFGSGLIAGYMKTSNWADVRPIREF